MERRGLLMGLIVSTTPLVGCFQLPRCCYNNCNTEEFLGVTMKALIKEASEYYSEEYGIPIVVRSRKIREFKADAKPDKLWFLVPHGFDPLDDTQDDGWNTRYNRKIFDDFVEDMVDYYAHLYETQVEEYSSTSDLKRLVGYWARQMDIPEPKVAIRKAHNRWGSFSPRYNGRTGNVMLHEFLKFVPKEIAEETIVHELVHAYQWYHLFQPGISNRKVQEIWYKMDKHGRAFWNLMDDFLPGHERLNKELHDLYKEVYQKPVPEMG